MAPIEKGSIVFVLVVGLALVVGVVAGMRWLVRRARRDAVPGRRRVWIGLLAIIGVAFGVLIFFVARDAYWGLRPTPKFELLGRQPDRSLTGTVAYISTGGNGKCVGLVAAAGRPTKQLACFESSPTTLQWVSPARLEVTHYSAAQNRDDRWRMIIDVRTGERESVPKSKIPADQPAVSAATGPNGERVDSSSSRGRLRVRLTDAAGTRELLSVAAPYTYTFGDPVWSPDGKWFVVKDDLDQIVLITVNDPSQTRVLVKDAYGPAVTGERLVAAAN